MVYIDVKQLYSRSIQSLLLLTNIFNSQDKNGPTSPQSPVKTPSKIPEYSRQSSATPSNKSQDNAKSRSSSRSRILKTPESPLEGMKKR